MYCVYNGVRMNQKLVYETERGTFFEISNSSFVLLYGCLTHVVACGYAGFAILSDKGFIVWVWGVAFDCLFL